MSSSVRNAITRAIYDVCERGVKKEYDVNDQVTSEIIEDMIIEAQEKVYGMPSNLDALILYHGKDDFLTILKGRIKKRHDDPPIYLFSKISTGWKIGPIDHSVSINSTNKGFDYLKYLLSSPGRSVSVVELYQGFSGVSEEEDVANKGGVVNDPDSDPTAIQEYKKRKSAIEIELEEADENLLNESKKDDLENELDQLGSLIREAVFKSGTASNPNKEKIWGCVKSSITQALKRIKKQSPLTYRYLKIGISIGYKPVYTPHPGFPSWELSKKPDN